jgi:leucyl aminopeptidase
MIAHQAAGLDSLVESDAQATPITLLRTSELDRFQAQAPDGIRQWIDAAGFGAQRHTFLRVPGARHTLLVGLGDAFDRWSLSHLPHAVGKGIYALDSALDAPTATAAALSWALGAYRFNAYRSTGPSFARLCWPPRADRAGVERAASAMALGRDLINTPANDLSPADLAATAQTLAAEFGAKLRTVVGDALIECNYPLIHAVGKGSDRPPQLIDMVWGKPSAPRITLVGKGVCFDTGGLALKPLTTMITMKDDMAGAATALALARMIMAAQLPVRLRVLIPAVENAIGSRAYRPSDVIRSRNGLTIEIADTDAEGRLILADALAEGSSERPDILIDFATLTGAAVAALGPDVPAVFCNDDELATALERAGRIAEDPVWRLPLWQDYAKDLQGKVADLTNIVNLTFGSAKMAGAIYAALFLERFVEPGVSWIHIDTFGWNASDRPGRPEGGEVRGLLACFHLLQERFATQAERNS